ncbi:MAG: hypothetical protein AAB289_11765, partial [Chloroflexota bacterium]
DIIQLFFDAKENLYECNPKAFTASVKAANNLLKIRSEFELDLYETPVAPNLLVNYPEGGSSWQTPVPMAYNAGERQNPPTGVRSRPQP